MEITSLLTNSDEKLNILPILGYNYIRREMSKKGFTLVEVLVAIFVLTIGIAGLIASFNASSKQIRSSNNIFLASRLAQDKIEELKNIDYVNLTDKIVSESTLVGCYAATRIYTITTIDIPALDAFKQIDITISWNEAGRNFQRSFVTYRANL